MTGQRSPLHGVGQVRLERKLRDEASARRWFERNPGESSTLCAQATGVSRQVATRVRREFGWAQSQRVLAVGAP